MFPQLKRKNKIPLQTTLSTSCLVFCPPHHSLTFKKNCGCHSLTTCFHLFHLFHTDVLMKQLSLKGPMLSPHQACVLHPTPTTCNMGVERIHFLKTAANKGVTPPHTHSILEFQGDGELTTPLNQLPHPHPDRPHPQAGRRPEEVQGNSKWAKTAVVRLSRPTASRSMFCKYRAMWRLRSLRAPRICLTMYPLGHGPLLLCKRV